VVESTRLESERAGNRTVGSNPTLSATPFIFLYLHSVVSIMVSALYRFPLIYCGKRGLQTCPSAEMATVANLVSTS
jgi:hypothetical protein